MNTAVYSIIGCDLRVVVEGRGVVPVLLEHSNTRVIAGGLDRKRQQMPPLNSAQGMMIGTPDEETYWPHQACLWWCIEAYQALDGVVGKEFCLESCDRCQGSASATLSPHPSTTNIPLSHIRSGPPSDMFPRNELAISYSSILLYDYTLATASGSPVSAYDAYLSRRQDGKTFGATATRDEIWSCTSIY